MDARRVIKGKAAEFQLFNCFDFASVTNWKIRLKCLHRVSHIYLRSIVKPILRIAVLRQETDDVRYRPRIVRNESKMVDATTGSCQPLRQFAVLTSANFVFRPPQIESLPAVR